MAAHDCPLLCLLLWLVAWSACNDNDICGTLKSCLECTSHPGCVFCDSTDLISSGCLRFDDKNRTNSCAAGFVRYLNLECCEVFNDDCSGCISAPDLFTSQCGYCPSTNVCSWVTNVTVTATTNTTVTLFSPNLQNCESLIVGDSGLSSMHCPTTLPSYVDFSFELKGPLSVAFVGLASMCLICIYFFFRVKKDPRNWLTFRIIQFVMAFTIFAAQVQTFQEKRNFILDFAGFLHRKSLGIFKQ